MAVETTATAQVFSLRTPLLAKGKSETLLAEADSLDVRIKVYAEGGENNVHAHHDHAHAFIILDGQATFHDKDGNATVVNRYEGILLPVGTPYRFENTGDTPLVLLRTAAGKTGAERTRAEGKTGPPPRPLTLDYPTRPGGGIPIPGKFVGD